MPDAQKTGLTDEEFEARLQDPALIETHEEALSIIDELEREIAHMQVQLDSYALKAATQAMPDDRQDWFRRCCYAAAMRRNELRRVTQRDKEIRFVKGPAGGMRKDPAVGLSKQARLHAEAEARKATRVAEHLKYQAMSAEIAERRDLARIFMKIAAEQLPSEAFEKICEQAVRRRHSILGKNK